MNKVITDWRSLIENIASMNETDLVAAINTEVSFYKRKNLIIRMHQRYTKLRSARERQELILGQTLL